MPSQVRCSCGTALLITEEMFGLQLACPTCGRQFVVQPPRAAGQAWARQPAQQPMPSPGTPPQSMRRPPPTLADELDEILRAEQAGATGGAAAASARQGAYAGGTACPRCGSPLQGQSFVCAYCGADVRAGPLAGLPQQATRVLTVYRGSPNLGGILAAVGVGCLLIAAVLAPGASRRLTPGRYSLTFLFLALGVGGCAGALVNLSCFDRLRVVYEADGRSALVHDRFYIFIPFRRQYDLSHATEVHLRHVMWRMQPALMFAIVFGLCLMGVIPGLIWWYFMLKTHHKCTVEIVHMRGRPYRLCLTGQQKYAERLARAVHKLTGLRLNREQDYRGAA